MNYWLVKFAPFRYSWQKILLHGKFEIYSVHNPQARNNLAWIRAIIENVTDSAIKIWDYKEGNGKIRTYI